VGCVSLYTDLTAPCCDLCILEKATHVPESLTPFESDILTLRERILSRKRPGYHTTQESSAGCLEDPIDVDAEPLRVRRGAGLGARQGDRLQACRNALTSWRLATWERDFGDSILMPDVVLPQKLLTKIASQGRLKTVSDIKEHIPDWVWADKYGQSVLDLLAPIDTTWIEESVQKKAENKAKRARISAEKKALRDENALAVARQATADRRAAEMAAAGYRASPIAIPQDIRPLAVQAVPPGHVNALAPEPAMSHQASPALSPGQYPYVYSPYYHIQYPYIQHPQVQTNQGAGPSSYPYPYPVSYPYPVPYPYHGAPTYPTNYHPPSFR
jgi:hypothetical protein